MVEGILAPTSGAMPSRLTADTLRIGREPEISESCTAASHLRRREQAVMTDQARLQRLGAGPDHRTVGVRHDHDVADTRRHPGRDPRPDQAEATASARVATVRSAPSSSRQAAATSRGRQVRRRRVGRGARRRALARGLSAGRRSKSMGESTGTMPWSAVTMMAEPAGSRSAIAGQVDFGGSSAHASDSGRERGR